MINWKYVKGLNEDDNGNNPLYTFIDFQYKENNTLADVSNLPHIFVNTINAKGDNDLGAIITSKAKNQIVEESFTFNDDLMANKNITFSNNNNSTFICHKNSSFDGAFTILDNNLTLQKNDTSTFQAGIGMINYTQFNFSFNNTVKAYLTSSGDFHTENKCEALYFNATSDRRAKDNLKILNFKALDLINHTNLYSFTYKDTNTPSIGIIAQDVQNVNIDGFKLVDNENATGQDMDYMSIHESKLVYILWQAIKEQQKEIEELKKRLN